MPGFITLVNEGQINYKTGVPAGRAMKVRPKTVSVVVLNYNGKRFLKDCLSSVESQDYPRRLVETLVVDNGSSDGSVEFVRNRFGWVKVVENGRNLGFSEGNNIGFKESSGEYVLLLNNDATIEPSWIRTAVENFPKDAAAIGGKIYFWGSNKLWFAGGVVDSLGNTFHRGFCSEDKGQFDGACDVDYMSGCAIMVSKKAVKELGALFDPVYSPIYYEEVDFCLRARKMGYKIVYNPELVAHHKVSQTTGHGRRANFYMAKNRMVFMMRNFQFWPVLIPISVARSFFSALFRMDFQKLAGTADAVVWALGKREVPKT